MSILTSWTFWLILGAIIIIMALIGYLAEGTEFASKALTKEPKQKKEKEQKDKHVPEIATAPNSAELAAFTPVQDESFVVTADKPIEILNVGGETPDAWADVIPKVDDRLETAYTVPSVDDWSVIPETENELPEVKLDNLETTEENTPVETQIDNDIFPDITSSDLEQDVYSNTPFEQDTQAEIPESNNASDTISEIPAEVPEETLPENKDTEDIWK